MNKCCDNCKYLSKDIYFYDYEYRPCTKKNIKLPPIASVFVYCEKFESKKENNMKIVHNYIYHLIDKIKHLVNIVIHFFKKLLDKVIQ